MKLALMVFDAIDALSQQTFLIGAGCVLGLILIADAFVRRRLS